MGRLGRCKNRIQCGSFGEAEELGSFGSRALYKRWLTCQLSGIVDWDSLVFEAVDKEGGATDGHEISSIVVSLFGNELSKKACEFPGQCLDTSEGADEYEGSWFIFLHEF